MARSSVELMSREAGPRPGAIIMLNGASSSGKSTLARGLQTVLADPFLHLSSDHLVDRGAVPNRRNESEPFGWPGTMRTRFFDGFSRYARGLSDVVDVRHVPRIWVSGGPSGPSLADVRRLQTREPAEHQESNAALVDLSASLNQWSSVYGASGWPPT